jgi:hypothetical protein
MLLKASNPASFLRMRSNEPSSEKNVVLLELLAKRSRDVGRFNVDFYGFSDLDLFF